MPRRRSSQRSSRTQQGWGRYLRKPGVQLGILIVVGILIFLIASLGGESASVATSKTEPLPALVDVDEAYQMYQDGIFVLDVRTPEEWNEFHVPDTTLMPLDELPGRLNELPSDQPILVVCRSGNRSQAGREILLQAGFNATSMSGGLNQWRDNGYPVASGP
jgi:rhodanese-related sulfurtransferase